MPYANNDGVKIHYEVEGEGPPLVLMHGRGGFLERWYDLGYVEALIDDYQLILVDARGHGKSDKPHDKEAYLLTVRVSDVTKVLDTLEINTTHYFGTSMGGYIGWGTVKYAPHRLRSLIVYGGGAYEETWDETVKGPKPLQKFMRQGLDEWCAGGEKMFGDYWQPKWKERCMETDLVALDVMLSMEEGISLDMLSQMKVPCMIITGEKDDGYPRAVKKIGVIPDAVFVPLAGLGHVEGMCRPDLIIPHIKKLLETVEQANKQ
jgi:pimeloyl-ACP methyl ester carboxylesterase